MTAGRHTHHWIVRGFERGYRALVHLAPASERSAWERDALPTFRAVCLAARTRGGWPSFVREGLRELFDLLRVIVGLRFGRARRAGADDLDPDAPPSNRPSDRRRGRGVRAWRDVRLAWRSLRAGGVATVIAVVTLALGIGVNAAIFSVLDSVLWRPVPFRDAARLVELWNVNQKFSYSGLSGAQIVGWRGHTDLFSAVEGYADRSFVFDNGRGAEMVPGALITPGMFRLLGVEAALGHTFGLDDGRGGSTEKAVVSHAFWRQRLGAAPDAAGREIRLDGRRYVVIGIMPATFRFPSGQEEIWLPYDVAEPPAGRPEPKTLTPIARLATGISHDLVASQVRARGERVNRATGGPPGVTAMISQTGDGVDQKTERSLWVLSGAVGFLFLIVCANVANLSLSRSLARARDLATCAALGAAPGDLVRTALVEQVLLAGAGGVAGLAVAAGALQAAIAALPEAMTIQTLNPIDLDLRTLVFMAGAGLLAALIFGVTPAVMAARTSVVTTLGGGGRASTGTRGARRFRATLAVTEVSVSVILLIGSALMARSFVKLATADPGFDTRDLISLRIGFPSVGYADRTVRERATLDLVERLRTTGGVDEATVGGLPSESGQIAYGAFEFDHDRGTSTQPIMVPLHEVPAGYFATLRLPMRAGRVFQKDDPDGSVIVNERFTAQFFPHTDAVGGRFRVNGGPWRTIVGIASNTDTGTDEESRRPEIYAPMGGASDALSPTMRDSTIVEYRTFLVRTTHPDAAVAGLHAAVHGYDPSLVIWKTALVERLLAQAIARPRVVFLMMSVFAGLGLVLSTAGLYGVLSCLVAQRRREIGVRLALGASPRQMRWLVLGRGLTLTAIGVAIGLGAALPLVQLMRTLLYDVDPTDPFAIATSAALLGTTALFACWWPARDAMHVNPVELLRGE